VREKKKHWDMYFASSGGVISGKLVGDWYVLNIPQYMNQCKQTPLERHINIAALMKREKVIQSIVSGDGDNI
jgi:hypothetical protein